MEKESSNNDAAKKQPLIRISKGELLKGVPPVAIPSLHGISSCTIKEEPDVLHFTKGLKPDDPWLNKPGDDLAPVMPLLSRGLIPAVEDLCSAAPNMHFKNYGKGAATGEPLKIILYRTVRELIDNAVKHASASNIFVQVAMEDRLVSITVHDDGKGFDPATVTVGAGLANMATAVIACKGKMNIHHPSEKGTEINIEIEL
jgi:hypothetical protein